MIAYIKRWIRNFLGLENDFRNIDSGLNNLHKRLREYERITAVLHKHHIEQRRNEDV